MHPALLDLMSIFNDVKNKLAPLPKFELPKLRDPVSVTVAKKAFDATRDGFTAAAKGAGRVATAAATVPDKAKRVVSAGADLAQRAAESNQTVGKGFDAVKQHVTGAARAFDSKGNIDQLGTRDSYKLAVGSTVSAEGAKATAGGSIVVSRGTDGKFTVGATGEAAAGLYAAAGAVGGAKGDVSGMVGGAGKVEYRFDTAAQAQRASQILLKQGLGVTAGERDFLQQHLSAFELRGSAAAQLTAKLGVGGALSVSAEQSLKDELSVRVELSHPPAIVVRNDFTTRGGVGGGLSLSDGGSPSSGASLPFGAARIDTKVSLEERYPLPDNVNLKALAAHPSEAAAALVAEGLKLPQHAAAKMTFTQDASGGALGSAAGVQSVVTLTTTRERIVAADALNKGGVRDALRALGTATDVSASVRSYHTYGVAAAPSVSVMGSGVGASIEGTRQDMADRPIWSYPPPGHVATVTEAGDGLYTAMHPSSPAGPPPRLATNIKG